VARALVRESAEGLAHGLRWQQKEGGRQLTGGSRVDSEVDRWLVGQAWQRGREADRWGPKRIKLPDFFYIFSRNAEMDSSPRKIGTDFRKI
jgi:hypothetical protein